MLILIVQMAFVRLSEVLMGKINSKQKGARGERELSKVLRDYGYEARRSQQFCGANGDEDLITSLDGIYVECKRVERLNIYDAIDHAKMDSKGTGKLPTVFHRKNNCEWLVTMTIDDWMKLYKGTI